MLLDNYSYSAEEIDSAAEKILSLDSANRVFLFEAEMGAGKTTLIKELCKKLKSVDNFSSPTFSIVNEYSAPSGKIFHFDLYRVKSHEELFNIGFQEYLDSGYYCFIEWPDLAKHFLDSGYIRVNISTEENKRYIRATKF